MKMTQRFKTWLSGLLLSLSGLFERWGRALSSEEIRQEPPGQPSVDPMVAKAREVIAERKGKGELRKTRGARWTYGKDGPRYAPVEPEWRVLSRAAAFIPEGWAR